MDNSFNYVGFLRELEDSRILFSKNSDDADWETIDIQNIEKMKFRKVGNKGKGVLIGALTGAAFGAAIGFTSGDDEPGINCDIIGPTTVTSFINALANPCLSAGDKARMNGVLLGMAGALIGNIAGSGKIIIPINGKQKNYELRRPDLSAYKVIN